MKQRLFNFLLWLYKKLKLDRVINIFSEFLSFIRSQHLFRRKFLSAGADLGKRSFSVIVKVIKIIFLNKWLYLGLATILVLLHLTQPLLILYKSSVNPGLRENLEKFEFFFHEKRGAVDSWQLPHFLKLPFYFFLPDGGINYYKLTDLEKQQWNDYVHKQLNAPATTQEKGKKNSLPPKLRTEEKNGWILFQSHNSGDKLEYSNFSKNPADYYFAPLLKVDLNQISAIYLSAASVTPSRLVAKVKYSHSQKLTGICYDIKDVIGFVTFRSVQDEIIKIQKGAIPPIRNLEAFNHHLYHQKLHGIARVAMFQDERLATMYPQLGISHKNGGNLLTKGRKVWVDPNKPEVQKYKLSVLWEVAASATAEIQLDYIRYPAEGDWNRANYYNIKDDKQKPLVLRDFLQKVHALTNMYGIPLSIDVFGVVAWQEPVDLKSTGQDLKILAKTVDILSPMLYPSHFGLSFGGIQNPGDHPFHFIYEGVRRMSEFLPPKIIIRPWLQAFGWRVSNYNADYIREQIRGTQKNKNFGYLLWNANNNYLQY